MVVAGYLGSLGVMSLVDELRQWWGWTGLEPGEVVGENDFGNLIVKDTKGKYWRVCPEDGYCRVIAESRAEFDSISKDQTFLHDWYMRTLVSLAEAKCGPLLDRRKYCLKIPGYLGGEYGGDNLATIPLIDLIRASGHLAHETADLPNGARVRLKVAE